MELESNLIKTQTEIRHEHSKDVEALKTKLNILSSRNSQLESELDGERKSAADKLSQAVIEAQRTLDMALLKDRSEIEKLNKELHKKNHEVGELKETIRKNEDEIDELERENVDKMKALQVSINSLLSSRTERRR